MKIKKKFNKLDLLTLEADMLSSVLDDVLKYHEAERQLTDIIYVSEILREKFSKIRALF